MEVIEELTAKRKWSKERHSSRMIDAMDSTTMDGLAKELAAVRSNVDNVGSSKRDGGSYSMENVNYVQNRGQNRQYNNNNYRLNQGGNNYNNYNGNRPHPNLSYSNNNYLQPPVRFYVTNGVINEPKKESIEDLLRNLLKRTESSQKATNNKVGLLEGAMSTMSNTLSGVTTQMSMIETHLSQLNKGVLDQDRRKWEEELKVMKNLDRINKKWAEESQRSAEIKVIGPLTGAGTSRAATESKSESRHTLNSPLRLPQRSASLTRAYIKLSVTMGSPCLSSPKRKQSLMSISNVF